MKVLNLLVIALGAAVGANLRYGVSLWAAQRFGTAFPYGTLIINVGGSLLIGALLTFAVTRPLSEPVRLLLVTGLLGGFTTFSSFGWETYALIMTDHWLPAGLYVVASLLLGLVGVGLGAGLVRLVFG